MGMSGIAAVVVLAALGSGGWSNHPMAAADQPAGQPLAGANASPGQPVATAPEPADPSTAAVPVPDGRPELRIASTVSPDPMIIGGESVYAVTVTNTGDQDAEEVTITDILGPGTAPGRLPSGCFRTDETITCGGAKLMIHAGQSVTYEIPVRVDPSLPAGTNITNRAQVSAPRATGDATQLISQIRTTADVEIVMTGPPTVTAGDDITYRLTVTNRGPSPAMDVTVRDATDGDRTTITSRPAECPGGGPAVTCPLGTLAPHASRTLTFTVTPDATGPIRNCATVHTGGGEEKTANNRSCTSTAVKPVRAPAPTRTYAMDPAESAITAPPPTPLSLIHL
ncbi:DUF11 domain-containing protein [Nonomuraea basaltis]|uniref:DUF11 domain-containing protein n=1 Tax=Nonomuraea basaltis TaxID=2495887 RepID=UPI00110C637B|nr:DUF11 domain-containing protein [Nonomuraea basaltis]TMR89325.1 DUF11 domain-containing protein [Nonomuraea basaltis]